MEGLLGLGWVGRGVVSRCVLPDRGLELRPECGAADSIAARPRRTGQRVRAAGKRRQRAPSPARRKPPSMAGVIMKPSDGTKSRTLLTPGSFRDGRNAPGCEELNDFDLDIGYLFTALFTNPKTKASTVVKLIHCSTGVWLLYFAAR